jgi:hypothetical protein
MTDRTGLEKSSRVLLFRFSIAAAFIVTVVSGTAPLDGASANKATLLETPLR